MLMSNPRVPTNPYNTEKPCWTSWHKRDISVPFKCFFTLENMPLLKLFNPICTYKKTKMFHYKRESVEMCVCCRLFISSTMFSVKINMQGTDGILIQPTVIHVHSILFNTCTKNISDLHLLILFPHLPIDVMYPQIWAFIYSSNSMNDISQVCNPSWVNQFNVTSCGSSGRVRGGGEKHEIYAAAFGGHLFYDLFLQGRGGPWPPRPPPGSATGYALHVSATTLKQAQLKYAGCRPTCTVHKVPSHV